VSTVGLLPTSEPATAPAVRTCYDLLTVLPACGITDLTEGKYVDDRNDRDAYLAAQERQAEYLLDQARCGPGTRLLDIGCGYGRILEHAKRREASAIGITISPPQVASGQARGLNVREVNYRHIFSEPVAWALAGTGPRSWEHAFNAVIANGSLEHFVQAADAAAGRDDEIYEEMFEIVHRLLVDGGRFVTTSIHFSRPGQFEPAQIVEGAATLKRGSDAYHFAMLTDWFAGWYPEPGQLEKCARDYFELVEEEDGTHDYHLTSEYWQRRCRRAVTFNPDVWRAVAKQLRQHPRAALQMLRLQFWDESWAWQFRPPAPMRLLRQTWAAK
jgi:cyclopropane fatty-acyl-phospholipid synthase-like methyltransferase